MAEEMRMTVEMPIKMPRMVSEERNLVGAQSGKRHAD